jgi:hypothetical protein
VKWKKWDRGEEEISKHRSFSKNHSPRCTSEFPTLNNTFVLAGSAALAHILARREVAFHLMSHEVGVTWVIGD